MRGTAQASPKSLPRRRQEPPRGSKKITKRPQEAPSGAQVAQASPKKLPRRRQEPPRGPQDGTRRSQESPKRRPEPKSLKKPPYYQLFFIKPLKKTPYCQHFLALGTQWARSPGRPKNVANGQDLIEVGTLQASKTLCL